MVPETFEASLTLLSHLLMLLKVPVGRVIRTIDNIRSNRYGMLRLIFHGDDAPDGDTILNRREELSSVILSPNAWAVGRTVADINARGARASVSAVRRDGIVGRDPSPDTMLKEGDVVVLYGTRENLEHAESVLLMG